MQIICVCARKFLILHTYCVHMHMKKILYIVLACLPWVGMAASGNANSDNYHFGYVSVSAGYTSLSQNVENVSTKGGLGLIGGLGYEFRHTGFWLSAGAQFQMENSQTTVGEYSTPYYSGIDDQRKPVNYRYVINQQDKQSWRTIDIPILLGYYISGFYVGAGAKVGFSVGSTTTGTYELIGNYPDLVGEFRNVNYYTTYSMASQTYNYPMRPQFSVLGELGYDLLSSMMTNSRICHVLKLGLYAEYGLRSVRPADAVEPVTINPENVKQAQINPYYQSTMTAGQRIVPFYVGVKLTYMLGGSRTSGGTWHRGCQCYGDK